MARQISEVPSLRGDYSSVHSHSPRSSKKKIQFQYPMTTKISPDMDGYIKPNFDKSNSLRHLETSELMRKKSSKTEIPTEI